MYASRNYENTESEQESISSKLILLVICYLSTKNTQFRRLVNCIQITFDYCEMYVFMYDIENVMTDAH